MAKKTVQNCTQKCDKCLTCGSYMYGCGGVESDERAAKCSEYTEDKFAYLRQDRDDTYIKPQSIINEEIDKAIKFQNQYKTKTYIFDVNKDDEALIVVCYLTAIPDINEEIIVHTEGKFTHYIVKTRIMDVNSETGGTVWNLYVDLKK